MAEPVSPGVAFAGRQESGSLAGSFGRQPSAVAAEDAPPGLFERDDDPYANITPEQAFDLRKEQIRLRRPLGRVYAGAGKTAESAANPLSLATFFYTWAVQTKAESKDANLEVEDIDPVAPGDSTAEAYEVFVKKWAPLRDAARARRAAGDKDALPPMLRAMVLLYPGLTAVYCVFMILQLGFPFVSVILLEYLTEFITDPTAPDSEGYTLAAILFGALILQAFSASQAQRIVLHLNNRIESGLRLALVKHSLQMTPEGMDTIGGQGTIFQYYAKDVTLLGACSRLLEMAGLVVQAIGAFIYLGFAADWPAVGAVAVFLVMTPLNYLIADRFIGAFIQKMFAGDGRTRKIVEILNNIRVVKMYGWEKPFVALVAKLREPELQKTSELLGLVAMLMCSFSVAAPLMLLAVYLLTLADDPDDLVTVTRFFESLSLINILNSAILRIPFLYSQWIQARLTAYRVATLLMTEPRPVLDRSHSSEPVLSIREGKFAWRLSTVTEAKEANVTKEAVNEPIEPVKNSAAAPATNEKAAPMLAVHEFSAVPGGLTMVVGRLGSGKSALMQSVLGELYQASGTSDIRGSIAYTPQSAWVLNATIRNNVVMFNAFDPRRYEEVLRAVALLPDLATLPNGDLTEVGEKGINLSGGQKQRLSLARALYQDADIYIFDDPLSALDAHVGRHVFQEAMTKLLAGKTRVLVTHALGFLPVADRLYIADEMVLHRINRIPSAAELQRGDVGDDGNAALGDLMRSWADTQTAEDADEAAEDLDLDLDASAAKKKAEEDRKAENQKLLEKRAAGGGGGRGGLTLTEERQSGRVASATYRTYFSSFGNPGFWVFTLLLHVITVGATLYGQLMLGEWAGGEQPWGDRPPEFYIGIYAAIVGGAGFVVLARELVWRTGAVNAPRVFYNKMSDAVFSTYMAFFDTTPVGRVINRFTKDSDQLDFAIPMAANLMFTMAVTQIGSLVVVCYVIPWFTPVAVVLLSVIAIAQPTAATVVLRRLASALSGPMTAQFAECVFGASSVRAAGMQAEFEVRAAATIDDAMAARTADQGLFAGVMLRMMTLSAFMSGGALVVLTLTREGISPARAAYVLSQVSSLSSSLVFFVMQRATFAMAMNGVERMAEFTTLPPEQSGTAAPPANWPSKGEVELLRVTARYREGTPIVLRDVSLSIRGGEKIGVVGRTGSGKSSFLLALFRLIPTLGHSSIRIDGVDIASMPIDTLRQRLSAIPQEPVLFSGTVHENLDPFGTVGKQELLKALAQCHLKEKLEARVKEGEDMLQLKLSADALSAGEKQLLCLARALARNQRILVLDEATSSVDPHTDQLIQQTIRGAFSDCTVITVAHRINTILDSDRILVLDGGRVAEFDAPQTLLRRPDGIFTGLVNSAKRND